MRTEESNFEEAYLVNPITLRLIFDKSNFEHFRDVFVYVGHIFYASILSAMQPTIILAVWDTRDYDAER